MMKSQDRMFKTHMSMNKMVQKQKEKEKEKEKEKSNNNNKFLIHVDVIGSSGPIRFVVNEKDVVSRIIETSLKNYAKEARLPVLGTHASGFLLYSAAGCEALNSSEPIGSHRGRNFVLCKKQVEVETTQDKPKLKGHKSNGRWKTWLAKSFNFKVSSH